MLTLQLKPLFLARGIEKPYVFLVKNGFSRRTAQILTSGKVKTISLDYVERLCTLLWCQPNDLLHWQPADAAEITPSHPLLPLSKQIELNLNLKKALQKVPLSRMEQLAESLRKEIEKSKEE